MIEIGGWELAQWGGFLCQVKSLCETGQRQLRQGQQTEQPATNPHTQTCFTHSKTQIETEVHLNTGFAVLIQSKQKQ